jgi:hypothetical protein
VRFVRPGELILQQRSFGPLVAKIDSCGLFRNTVVVITSGDDNELRDHVVFNQALGAYLQEIDVRLPITSEHAPVVPQIAVPVSLRDVPPTVVDVAGAGTSSMSFSGPVTGGMLASGDLIKRSEPIRSSL